MGRVLLLGALEGQRKYDDSISRQAYPTTATLVWLAMVAASESEAEAEAEAEAKDKTKALAIVRGCGA
jgi:hypothetical protein